MTEREADDRGELSHPPVVDIARPGRLDLRTASELSGLPGDLILYCVRRGMIEVRRLGDESGEPFFDDGALRRLRLIADLRGRRRAGMSTVRRLLALIDRLERAEAQLRRLRDRDFS